MVDALLTDSAPKKTQSVMFRFMRVIELAFRYTMKILLVSAFIAGGFFVGGFLNFANSVSNLDLPNDISRADGIVALTGGSARISSALDLLEQKKGQRLLITGVNQSTNLSDIRKLNADHRDLFDCCVDSEDVALDTVGNARETARWATDRGYSSLIVVTSGYHMPRSLLEFKRHLPGVTLVGYPVPLKELEVDGWWKNTNTLRLILSEYVKYVAANLRDYMSDDVFAALRTTLRTV